MQTVHLMLTVLHLPPYSALSAASETAAGLLHLVWLTWVEVIVQTAIQLFAITVSNLFIVHRFSRTIHINLIL